ncbi:family M1 unassigned peptidase [Nanobdella aerobiophila]|uniref:Family M1 unassigned peptidase n=1 Tax=Nanobdella aerobiophila TaxID=2586965 RepID=A0A915WRK3_9ARCH|nr:M48 family metallopeptidase [Nanobdella aerobiophila]BBL45738.1 family M1 unassigned peptidase [Nanobdella aerobiophila]
MSREVIKLNNLEFNLEIKKVKSKNLYVEIKGDRIIIKTNLLDINKIKEKVIDILDKYKITEINKDYIEKLSIFGVPYKLIIKNIRRKYLINGARKIIIVNFENKKDFCNYLNKTLYKYTKNIINKYSKELNIINIPSIEIKTMKTRYGYYNIKDNKITINSLSIVLPRKLINFIIFHELVHYYIYDHEKIFKNIIKKKFRESRELESELKRWSFIIFYNELIRDLFDL